VHIIKKGGSKVAANKLALYFFKFSGVFGQVGVIILKRMEVAFMGMGKVLPPCDLGVSF